LGETILEAVKREPLEETGVEVEPVELFQVYDNIVRDDAGRIAFHYLVHYVHARYIGGEPRPQDDAVGTLWADESDVAQLQMHPFVRQTALTLLRAAGGSSSSEATSQG
jgi:ADP-ribose pyrophosphatase YjhB (NUDIX family)